jgi:hypothetical protein
MQDKMRRTGEMNGFLLSGAVSSDWFRKADIRQLL